MKRYAYGGYPPPILPGMEEYLSYAPQITIENDALIFQRKSAKKDSFFLQMCECCNFTSIWQMPIVAPEYDTQILNYEIIGYDRLSNPNRAKYGMHFYCNDSKILSSLWSAFSVYERIKSQPFVIGPDYSIKMNMPFPQKLGNSFNIKLVTAWYQYMGVHAVPNVVWADEYHIEAYLDGYPTGSILAINSTGIGRDARAIKNWQAGYQYVIEVLKPIAIIRYGVRISGEIQSISYYKQNDNLKSCSYGW